MNNVRDFGQSLVAAMQVALRDSTPGVFTKAALALRAWYRHEVLRDKPELIVEMSSHKLVVYGGAQVVRAASGELATTHPNWTLDCWSSLGVSSIGEWLARFARSRIQEVYFAKASAYVESQVSADEQDEMLALLERLNLQLNEIHNVPWWRRSSTMKSDINVLNSLLWQSGIFDRAIFSYCVRLSGLQFSLELYNLSAQKKDELVQRLAEAPNLAPLLTKGVPGNLYSQRAQLQTHQNVWQDLRQAFIVQGGTAQAWKWLCHQGAKWFHHVTLNKGAIRRLNKVAELQLGKVPYHQGLVSAMLQGHDFDERYLDVFKAAVLANKKRKLKVDDFQACFLIFDYLLNVPDARTQGATWASLMRKQRTWHTEDVRRLAEARRETGICYGWVPLTSDIIKGDLAAISLNNSDELWEESQMMLHCVGTYDEDCYQNRSRIYSIRRGVEHLATMEVRKMMDNSWAMTQLYGPQNVPITSLNIKRLAKQVLSQCRKAERLSLFENKLIREATSADKELPAVRHPVFAQHEDLDGLPW